MVCSWGARCRSPVSLFLAASPSCVGPSVSSTSSCIQTLEETVLLVFNTEFVWLHFLCFNKRQVHLIESVFSRDKTKGTLAVIDHRHSCKHQSATTLIKYKPSAGYFYSSAAFLCCHEDKTTFITTLATNFWHFMDKMVNWEVIWKFKMMHSCSPALFFSFSSLYS